MAQYLPGDGDLTDLVGDLTDLDEGRRRVAAASTLAETLRTRHPDDGFLMHPALEITATGPDSVHVCTNAAVGHGEILLVVPGTPLCPACPHARLPLSDPTPQRRH